MKAKRAISAMLAVLLSVSALTACSGDTSSSAVEESSGASSSVSESSSESGEASQEGKLTEISIFATMWGNAAQNLKDYNENLTFQELEKRTGVHVNWIHPPAGQDVEQFNLMIASQNLPDVIAYDWFDTNKITGGMNRYYQDGIIIDLTSMMDEHAPNFMALMEANPEARRQAVDDEGRYFAMPMLRLDDRLRVTGGPQIRLDWLEKLGLEVPTTVDELHDVLYAIRTQDPNGNGQQDEIPFTAVSFRGGNGVGMLCSMWRTSYDFYVDNGTVKFGPIQPEFKEAITTIAQWFSEGLIDPDYMLNDGAAMNARFTDDISAMRIAGQPTSLMQTMAESGVEPEFNVVGMDYIAASDGVAYSVDPMYNQFVTNPGLAITTKAEMPEQILEWIDYAYGEEGNILFNLGVEGDSYTMVDGKPKYTEKVTENNNAGYAIYHMALNGWAMSQDVMYHEQLMEKYGYPAAEHWRKADRSLVLPPLSFTEEETDTVSRLETDIDTYVDEMCDKFTTGQIPLDQFDSYVQTVNGMGIEELTAIYQAAYDRYMAR